MSLDQLISDMQAQEYSELHDKIGASYHEVMVASRQYALGTITPQAYNAKIEEAQRFLESIKYDRNK